MTTPSLIARLVLFLGILWHRRKFIFMLMKVVVATISPRRRPMLPGQIPAAAPEVAALGSALNDFLSAMNKGQSAIAAAETAGVELLAASNGIQRIGADIKLPHNQVYLAWAIIQVYEPEGADAAA